jgi:DNA-binding MarR family transcriptional regulator
MSERDTSTFTSSARSARRPTNFEAPIAEMLWSLSRIESALVSGLTTALTEEHATLDQWRILEALSRLDVPTMGELASATGMSNAGLSRIVDTLEDTARAYRLPNPDDRRRISVHLSDLGRKWLVRIRAIVQAWEESMERTLGADVTAELQNAVRTTLHEIERPTGA